jgi:hypothetical protein
MMAIAVRCNVLIGHGVRDAEAVIVLLLVLPFMAPA